MEYSPFLTIAAVQLMAVMSPGPDFFVVLRMSLAGGRKAGLWTALGIGAGNSIHVGYTVFGLAALISHTPSLFRGIQIAGAFVIIYLGASCFRSTPKKTDEAAPLGLVSSKSAFSAGFLTNLFNGHATLWYISIMSQYLGQARSVGVRISYGVELLVITVGWFLLLAWMIGHPVLRTRIERWQRVLVYVLGVVLILLGGRILIKTAMTFL